MGPGRKFKLDYPEDGLREHAAQLAEAVPDAVKAVLELLRSKDPELKKQKAEVALKILTSLNMFDVLKSVFAEDTTKSIVDALTKQYQEVMKESKDAKPNG